MTSIHEQPGRVEPTNLRLEQAPILFRSFEELAQRKKLSAHYYVPENEPSEARYSFAYIFARLGKYVAEKYPFWQVRNTIRAYENVLHGETARTVTRAVSPYPNCFAELPMLVQELRSRTGVIWTSGISGSVRIKPGPKRGLEDRIWEEFSPQMVVPMADLEIPVTENPASDIENVANKLAQNSFSGMILRSGRRGMGGYHYLGDFLLPAQPFFWQVEGRLIELLTDDHHIREIGYRLSLTESHLDACRVAQDILDQVPSETETDSMIDVRWVAHSLLRVEGPFLRTESGRHYLEGPKLVAGIY